MDKTTIWTASACLRNPGPGGYAVTVQHPDGTVETRQDGRRHTTNNRMEIYAAISGLSRLPPSTSVEIRSSSTYLVNTINNGQTTSVNSDLWNRLNHLLAKHKVTASWHKARSTQEHYDAHAKAMAQAQHRPAKLDTGYEKFAGPPPDSQVHQPRQEVPSRP